MSTEVVVRLRPEISRAARGQAESAPSQTAATSIAAVAERHGGTLVPLHSDPADPDLGGYFRIAVASPGEGEALARALHGLDGVEAAYVKPLPAMP